MKLSFSPFLLLFFFQPFISAGYLVGIGIHDVTGPVGGVNFMGYAMLKQITHGIHTRLYSRAFIFINERTGKRIVFCSSDLAMISPNIKRGVVALLQEKLGFDYYSQENLILSATHTHSAPGGYHDYLLYSITSLGYVKETADVMIYGIFKAIERAHHNLNQRQLKLSIGSLTDANINRSPTSYLENPLSERLLYTDGDTDKSMLLLNILDSNTNQSVGMISWFSVHCTSMNNTNRLIDSDNKGYASYLLEHEMNSQLRNESDYTPYLSQQYHKLAESGSLYVAAFAQTNEGDVSPNINGAFCLNNGKPCNLFSSTCKDDNGRERNEFCHAHGPGWEYGGDKESSRIIGLRQYIKAKSLLTESQSSTPFMTENLLYEHAWIDMSKTIVRLANGSLVRTCSPARGFSFAAGTTDGPGALDFIQGDNSTGNPFWNFVKGFISKPSKEQVHCQFPKPILLNTGEIKNPYPWEPKIVDIQLAKIGSLFILAVPAEFTTMAGRRLKKAVQDVFIAAGTWPNDGQLVIAGLSNSYSGYVTTFEEYQAQRYEAASTIYGPYTLDAYIQEFKRLAVKLVKAQGKTYRLDLPDAVHDPLVPPEDFTQKLLSFLPPVVTDAVPFGAKFGNVVKGKDVRQNPYQLGDEVSVMFYSGNPRSLSQLPAEQLENYFMSVEKYVGPPLNIDIQEILMDLFQSKNLIIQSDESLAEQMNIKNAFYEWTGNTESIVEVYPRFLPSVDVIELEFLQKESEVPFYLYLDPFSISISLTTGGILKSNAHGEPNWMLVRDDSDWDTEFHWLKEPSIFPLSYAKAVWKITKRPDKIKAPFFVKDLDILKNNGDSMTGLYRIKYRGSNRNLFGKVSIHEGASSLFRVQDGEMTLENPIAPFIFKQ